MRISVYPIERLVVGMLVCEDVLTADHQVLIKKDTRLTSRLIARLKFYSIKQVSIDADAKAQEPVLSYYERIERTPEFKRFNLEVKSSVSNLEHSLNKAIKYNEEIEVDDLLENVDHIVNDSRNGMHLMHMIQCIRSYDDLTYVHCVNVSLICNIIGDWINLPKDEVRVLTLCGLLHDIGKLVIPNEILTKPGKLTNEEYEIMKTHAVRGYEILKTRNLDERIKLAALQHHERSDGSGYPLNLPQSKTSDFSRIVAIADVYDAMTANRVYRQGICPFDVIDTFEKEGYQKYDPKYLVPFLEHTSQCYIHSNVQMSDGRTGEVILINNHSLSKPVVKIDNTDDYIDLSEDKTVSIKQLL